MTIEKATYLAIKALFAENPSNQAMIESHLRKIELMIQTIDAGLTKSIVEHRKLLSDLYKYKSVPLEGRYDLIPVKTAHDTAIATMRVMLDDLKTLKEQTTDCNLKIEIACKSREIFDIMLHAALTGKDIDNAVNGIPIEDNRAFKIAVPYE